MRIIKKSIFILLIISILSAILLPANASANNSVIAYGAANVATSGLRVRSGPGLDHSILTNLDKGSVVVILERTNKDWFRINHHGTVGFVNTSFLENVREAANFTAHGRVTGSSVNMREKPSIESDIVTAYSKDTILKIIGINHGWYKIDNNGLIGYIRSDLLQKVSGGSSGNSASENTSSSSNSSTPANISRGQEIANFALQFRGAPYVWAGSSPSGFDCSGLVSYVFRNFGIRISRSATAQWTDNGVRVSRSELIPGDLIFFTALGGSKINHVGIYIGNNQYIHSSSPGVGVIVSNLTGTNSDRYFGAKRLV